MTAQLHQHQGGAHPHIFLQFETGRAMPHLHFLENLCQAKCEDYIDLGLKKLPLVKKQKYCIKLQQ
jgi:hypothetical protein